ncbi:glycosyltransferase family protein [Halovulum sp. GXIMD14793]
MNEGASGGRSRWKPKFQAKRRSVLAQVRNHLIAKGLRPQDKWCLWIDVDVCDYPPDVLNRLLDTRASVVVPNCVLDPAGQSFDMNSFVEMHGSRDYRYYKRCHGGVFQPPIGYGGRRHLNNLRFVNQTHLTGVGGTMLLVRADLHRAGLIFPERPYCDLLETEGFGKLCCDFGVTPIGLPNLEIRHVKS